jgi:hypothetical protein
VRSTAKDSCQAISLLDAYHYFLQGGIGT